MAQNSASPKPSDLQRYVKPYAADLWEDIGTGLELFDNDPDGKIFHQIENSSDPFNATMRLWLKDKTKATWSNLLACLKEIPGLEQAVQSIEENVPGLTNNLICLENPPGSIPSNSVPESPTPHPSSQPPISIPGPPPEAVAGQPPYCITGPQSPFPPPPPQEEEPLPNLPQFSLKLKQGHSIRNYQRELAAPGIGGENYIFVAPTGSGKTLVAALVISEHLKKTSNSDNAASPQPKVIFMVNTQPLADQQTMELRNFIHGVHVKCCVGDNMGSIGELLPHSDIIVCTAGKLLDEIRKDSVKLSDISLMVVDECHHTRKNAPQAKIMEHYLEAREEHGDLIRLPQVVGLTASPGSGDILELEATIEHLLTLCARMDATSGIKLVRENRQELEQFTNKPSFTLEILNRRSAKEEFISVVEREMQKLEQLVPNLKCPSPRWSQEYETCIQQQKHPLEISTNEQNRDRISILNVLRCYSQVLNVYMDLRNIDAISVLEEFKGLPENNKLATPKERVLKENMAALIVNLQMLQPVENPLLKKAEEKLSEIFHQKRESRGIIFVRTKKHARAICDWIKRLPIAPSLDLKPREITGHTNEISSGMTKTEQEEVMKSFHSGDCNLLVATSVAEEGLDVPACNLVIRFQHVTNEIAKVQTVGRARAAESEGLTILSSDSKKTIQEIKNDERLALVDEIFDNGWFPSKQHLSEKLAEKQRILLREMKLKRKLKQNRRQQQDRDEVCLLCKKCKTFACFGSDVYSSESTTQYVVPRKDFRDVKIVKKPHHNPGKINDNVSKTHKIYCANCDEDWGVSCVWRSEGHEYPVLKCKSFIFKVNGVPRSVSKWSMAPFEVLPLSKYFERLLESDDSEDDSD